MDDYYMSESEKLRIRIDQLETKLNRLQRIINPENTNMNYTYRPLSPSFSFKRESAKQILKIKNNMIGKLYYGLIQRDATYHASFHDIENKRVFSGCSITPREYTEFIMNHKDSLVNTTTPDKILDNVNEQYLNEGHNGSHYAGCIYLVDSDYNITPFKYETSEMALL